MHRHFSAARVPDGLACFVGRSFPEPLKSALCTAQGVGQAFICPGLDDVTQLCNDVPSVSKHKIVLALHGL